MLCHYIIGTYRNYFTGTVIENGTSLYLLSFLSSYGIRFF